MAILLLAQILSLTGLLANWAAEISQQSGTKVVVIQLEPGEFPQQEPHRTIARQHFAAPSFQQLFLSAQALSLNPPSGKYQYILVNRLLAPKDPDALTGLLAHELGHLWIKAQGYAAPKYLAGEAGCLSVTTGDALQHILMRDEMDRRGIIWRPGLVRQFIPALEKMAQDDQSDEHPQVPRCQRLAQVLLWLDVELGISDKDWDQRIRFLNLMEKRFPEVAVKGKQLAQELAKLDLRDKQVHRQELVRVFESLKKFVLSQP